MKIYADMLRNIDTHQALVEARFQAGQVTTLDIFLAKNERLLIEVSMEREKQ